MAVALSQTLQDLEAEAITILREMVASFGKPVMLYSAGKDSSVLVHLASKAFYPSPLPFPLLHIDTGWKFAQMIHFRDALAREQGHDLLVHTNPQGAEQGVNPVTSRSAFYTEMMKTNALKQALDAHGFDAAIGGARRDEEKSRAKERIFSVREDGHRWDPRAQRPELWNLFNTKLQPGQSMRVFPLSNWSELDIWRYIEHQSIALVPLYFAAPRPVVWRSGQWIMVDDGRLPLQPGESVQTRTVRFRTLGCYPLSGAIESNADTLEAIIQEVQTAKTSERQGRLIDSDTSASMEKKKCEGYF